MRKQTDLLLGALVGAGLMYLLDPDRGRRRRALIRDQVVHGAHELGDLGGAAASRARDLRNRAVGTAAEAQARLRREDVEDTVVEARVRSELGRLVSRPGAVEVSAEHGRVTLRGDVLEREVEALVAGVEGVRGVRDVVNRTRARAEPDGQPNLQG